MQLLARLLDVLLPPRDTAKSVREATDESLGALLSPRHEGGVTSLLPYRHRLVRAITIEAKFSRNERALTLLASVLRSYEEALTEEYADLGGDTRIYVPIPLGEVRRKERGYNQVEEVLKRASLPHDPLLKRMRETAPQTTLTRAARIKNMENTFAMNASALPNTTYVIVDDVMTTGATLRAAEAALRAAGVTRIELLALAH